MRINMKYGFAFIVLLLLEVFIALFIHDKWIRPYGGDVLVVILMYAFVRALIVKQIKYLPLYLFIFASCIEFSQYFKLVEVLNMQNNRLVSTIMGSSFSLIDLGCYLMGAMILIIWEKLESKHKGCKLSG